MNCRFTFWTQVFAAEITGLRSFPNPTVDPEVLLKSAARTADLAMAEFETRFLWEGSARIDAFKRSRP